MRVIYHKREFGHEVHEVEVDLHDYTGYSSAIKQFPPDSTVYAIQYGNMMSFNDGFDEKLYWKRLEEKKWAEEYEARTGKKWTGDQNAGESSGYKNEASERPITREMALQILGLSEAYTKEDLKQAYREKMKKNHPDKVADLDGDFRAMAERKAKRINQALDLLQK